MHELATAIEHALARGETPGVLLEHTGAPEPLRTARALGNALKHPDLATSRYAWLPLILCSARPAFAAESLLELAGHYRTQRGYTLELRGHPALPLVLGCSSFLAARLLRDPECCDELRGDPPPPPAATSIDRNWDAIRAAKYRGLLRIAARDLLGRAFQESLDELSELADGCLRAALDWAAEETEQKPPALLALGKLGGHELNFASDVDLLFLYEAPSSPADLERNHEVETLVRHFKRQLEQPTEYGFGYRVDLDLRPEGPTGALSNSVHAALGYYENFGAEWERQALIRLRYVAGDRAAARAFETGVLPFVYRRSIGLDALRSVGAMKARIETERRSQRSDLDSDLDLIFLYAGSPEDGSRAARTAQRAISYLTTMTGAGVAYAVDARLRPSGQQGALVTSFDAFESYQCEQAQAWEHLALVRARSIAGSLARGQATLARVRRAISDRYSQISPSSTNALWSYVREMRERVERERGREDGDWITFKTGPGGLMDVEFLAAGTALECGTDSVLPNFPSVPALLRAAAPGPATERLLEDYACLRRVEARARWAAGRAVEGLRGHSEESAIVCALIDSAVNSEQLLDRLAASRARVRTAFAARTKNASAL